MKIEQSKWSSEAGWEPASPNGLGSDADLVFIFGSTAVLKEGGRMSEIRSAYPNAQLAGCSTAGEICGTQVRDETLVCTAIAFKDTVIKGTRLAVQDPSESFDVGCQLAKSLTDDDLIHVFVLSDGLGVNGSELVRGLTDSLPDKVTVTGGLSGDGARFEETLVVWDDGPEQNTVAAIGLYGKQLRVGYGSLGGWDPFGPERHITRSEGNVLYELDGKSALEIYKQYLGEHAADLPSSGLLFPLAIRMNNSDTAVVRTILAVDEAQQSMTFAGDVPVGSYAQFMKANFNRLVDGAVGAAKTSYEAVGSTSPDLAILISCVGRKLVLKQRIEEEVEGVRDVLGDRTVLTGFYSYGEISPFTPTARCELHNQTMTITTFSEV